MKQKTTIFQRKQALLILMLLPLFIWSQPNTLHWKLGGNTAAGIDAVTAGNNSLGTIPNLPLNFITNGTQRMLIYNGGTSPSSGQIGIGNNLPNAFVPTARLHIHETGSFPNLGSPFMRFTTNTTGAAATDGYEMGIDPFGFASLINYEYGQPISFNTDNSSGAGGSPVERARLFGVTNSPSTPNNGGFGINATPGNSIIQPGAYLHIGEPVGVGSPISLTGLTGAFGWRDWMSIGKLSYSGTDNFYVGLKDEFVPPNPQLKSYNSDRQDAVLAWGDNNAGDPGPAGGSIGPDYLRFINLHIYNNGSSAPSASEENGLEVMRMSPNTNIGIGNFYNDPNYATKDPLRRLEILANRATSSAGEAQLRLTYAQQGSSTTNTNAGIFTDIWNTNLGDLAILPTDNTQANSSTKSLKQRFVGIQTNTPGNSLEINSQYASFTTPNGQPQAPNFGAPTGWAGLRFTDLTSGSTLQDNPSPGVLSVNAQGDVILVKDQVGTGGGGGGVTAAQNGTSIVGINANTVELGLNPLLHATTIPCNNKNFEINYSSISNISIGNNPSIYPTSASGVAANIALGQVNTFNDQQGIALGKSNNMGFQSIAIGYGNNLQSSNASLAFGVNIKLENTGTTSNVATGFGIGEDIHNYSSHATVIGREVVLPRGSDAVAIGSHFSTSAVTAMETYIANNPSNTLAQLDADARANQNGLQASYIPGITVSNGNKVGIGTYVPQAKMDIYGTCNVNGQAVTSDSTLKTNIHPVAAGAMNKVKSLRAVTYEWINKVDTFMYGTQYGFTAQQVQTVIPDLVKTTSDNKLHLNYNGLLALYAKALQEQQAQVDSLKEMIAACCSNNARTANNAGKNINALDVELSDADAIVLDQNFPNPFAEQTTITYNIPKNVSAAQILFYDVNGRLIKTVDVTKKGKGQLNVFANDLSNGIYSYTLIADGKIFETKKMVKQQ